MIYILNKYAPIKTGYHKIHTINCSKKPTIENSINLGECICPIEAKSRAKEYCSKVSGCKYCCRTIYFQNKIG